MRKPTTETVTVVAGGLFTIFIWGVAFFFQLLLASFSPALLHCRDFPPQLFSMGTTLFLEGAFFSFALFVTLRRVFNNPSRTAGIYTRLFVAGCCCSAVWWILRYYQNNGC